MEKMLSTPDYTVYFSFEVHMTKKSARRSSVDRRDDWRRARWPSRRAPASPQKLPLAERIAHTVPEKYRASPSVHGGPGQLDYMGLFNATALDTNLYFLHRGIIQPKSGIGAHFHNQCEEMFVIFDGEAQFTIDGRTSVLKGPAGAPVRMGTLARDLQPHRQAGAVDEHQRVGTQGRLRRVRPERRPRRRAARSDPDVHDDAAGSGAAAARRRAAIGGQGNGAVSPRACRRRCSSGRGRMSIISCSPPGSVDRRRRRIAEIGEFYYVMNGRGHGHGRR